MKKDNNATQKRIVQHYFKYTNISSKEPLENLVLKDVNTWLWREINSLENIQEHEKRIIEDMCSLQMKI